MTADEESIRLDLIKASEITPRPKDWNLRRLQAEEPAVVELIAWELAQRTRYGPVVEALRRWRLQPTPAHWEALLAAVAPQVERYSGRPGSGPGVSGRVWRVYTSAPATCVRDHDKYRGLCEDCGTPAFHGRSNDGVVWFPTCCQHVTVRLRLKAVRAGTSQP